ncbi:MAG: DoxX family protein [Actinomycetota bacterium]|nr:DoxX family protein [Actinomycetota bacterium]
MTSVPIASGAVGAIPSADRPSLVRRALDLEASAEAGVTVLLQRWSIPLLRVALGAVFAVFGILKAFPGVSPIEPLVLATWEKLSFGMVTGQTAMVLTAVMEVVAGLLIIVGGGFARVGLVVLAVTFVGILSPIVLLPHEVFAATGPTLIGQYIFKDAVLIAAALVVASRVLRGPAPRS